VSVEHEHRPTITAATQAFILGVCLLALLGFAAAVRVGAKPQLDLLVALLLLSAVLWAIGDNRFENHLGLSLVGVVLLASAVFLGPLGAGLFGLLIAGLSRDRQPWSARLFNMALSGLLGVVTGLTYAAMGGRTDPERLRGLGPAAVQLGWPLLVADTVQALLNVILIAGIMRVSQGVPLRLTASRLLLTIGALALAYGVVAFLLVLLWLPAGVGPFSVVLVFLPLLGAQWALGQYTAQRRAQEEHLDLLVAAIDARLPHLAGHARRVGRLSGRMAEHLGLGAADVRDIERAGLLHDLGHVGLPPELTHAEAWSPPRGHLPTRSIPGSQLIADVAFLAGTVAILHRHESGAAPSEEGGVALGSQIVALASAYDMWSAVQGAGVGVEDFVAQTARSWSGRVVEALSWTTARESGVAP
jgi:hypothetical protein